MSNSLQPHGLYLAHQAPLSMRFPRQEYWSGLPFPSPGHLPNPGIKPGTQASSTLAGGFFTISATWKTLWLLISIHLTLLHPYLTSSLTPSRPPVHWPFLLSMSHFPSSSHSINQLCPTLCDPMDCSMAGFSVLHCLTKLAISLASLFLSKANLKPMIQLYSTLTLCNYA